MVVHETQKSRKCGSVDFWGPIVLFNLWFSGKLKFLRPELEPVVVAVPANSLVQTPRSPNCLIVLKRYKIANKKKSGCTTPIDIHSAKYRKLRFGRLLSTSNSWFLWWMVIALVTIVIPKQMAKSVQPGNLMMFSYLIINKCPTFPRMTWGCYGGSTASTVTPAGFLNALHVHVARSTAGLVM